MTVVCARGQGQPGVNLGIFMATVHLSAVQHHGLTDYRARGCLCIRCEDATGGIGGRPGVRNIVRRLFLQMQEGERMEYMAVPFSRHRGGSRCDVHGYGRGGFVSTSHLELAHIASGV